MTYKVEVGRDRMTYGSAMRTAMLLIIDVPAMYPVIADVLDVAKNDPDPKRSQEASDLLATLPDGAEKWLRDNASNYHIEAEYACKAIEDRVTSALLGGDALTYGYVLTVCFEDPTQAMLFKLTFGGA